MKIHSFILASFSLSLHSDFFEDSFEKINSRGNGYTLVRACVRGYALKKKQEKSHLFFTLTDKGSPDLAAGVSSSRKKMNASQIWANTVPFFQSKTTNRLVLC